MRSRNRFLVPLGLLVAVGVISSISMGLRASSGSMRTLFFPPFGEVLLTAERRYLPRQGSLTGNVAQLIGEALLGPLAHDMSPMAPRTTRVYSTIVKGETTYVNLSRQLFSVDEAIKLSPRERAQTIANDILYNFRSIRAVYILVEGQVPAFDGRIRGRGSHPLLFERSLLR